jgi:hypothetical protein
METILKYTCLIIASVSLLFILWATYKFFRYFRKKNLKP